MHIGVDVGGTNTDAVLLNGTEVLASVKVPTTMDIGSGVVGAISDLLTRSGTDPTQIQSVMIGTTQFTNAFVEGKKLVPVAVYRAALPATEGVLPMIEFPSHLTRQIGTQSYLVGGGYEFDGRMIAPLDEKAVIEGAKDMRAKGIKSAVLSSVFTPINSEMEHRMAEIILNEAPDTELTLSGEIGRIGLIERENAAIMNASLCELSKIVVHAFRNALKQLNINCPFFVSQNDGTLMTAEFAEKYPVLTFASGPTNSMRGAAFLSGVSDGIVVDIGGTTSDVEHRMAEIILNEAPDTELTLSGEIGRIGLIERENAAIMNASLCELSKIVVHAFRNALKQLNINCPFFVSQNRCSDRRFPAGVRHFG